MVSRALWRSWLPAGAALAAVATAVCGCATVGPKSITAGRVKYAEAINRTEDEQLLLSIVKGRYGETSSFLTVNGVAANLRFRAEFGVEAGFPGVGDPGDDLLLGGVAYEENPTITYTPVQGDLYVRQLLAPIPLDILVMALRSVAASDRLFELLVSRINDLRNPSFLYGATADPDPGFLRFIELFTELSRANVLEVVVEPREDVEFNLLVSDYEPAHRAEVDELLGLLGLVPPPAASDDLVIPVYLGVVPRNTWAIGVTTRSTFDLVEVLRATVAVPPEHADAGLTLQYPALGLPGRGVAIRSASARPASTTHAVEYRGRWFYISDEDQITKAAFNMLRSAWSLCIDKSVDGAKGPVLTIPVGGP